jgi:hypothetical protein
MATIVSWPFEEMIISLVMLTLREALRAFTNLVIG